MEQLIQELEKLNKIIADCNSMLGAILEDIKRIAPLPWGSESDNKNGDSNFEREQ